MLRINLLHDDKEQTAGSGPHSALFVIAGLLVLLLCAAIALFGWLTLQNNHDHARDALAEAQKDLEALQSRRGPADYEGLVALEGDALLLEALAQHQSQAPRALAAVLEALRLNDRRGGSIAIDQFSFDGQIITARGTARSMNTLGRMLTTLEEEDALQDARLTTLRAADEPLTGRARRLKLNAIDFTFYAAIASPPLEVQD